MKKQVSIRFWPGLVALVVSLGGGGCLYYELSEPGPFRPVDAAVRADASDVPSSDRFVPDDGSDAPSVDGEAPDAVIDVADAPPEDAFDALVPDGSDGEASDLPEDRADAADDSPSADASDAATDRADAVDDGADAADAGAPDSGPDAALDVSDDRGDAVADAFEDRPSPSDAPVPVDAPVDAVLDADASPPDAPDAGPELVIDYVSESGPYVIPPGRVSEIIVSFDDIAFREATCVVEQLATCGVCWRCTIPRIPAARRGATRVLFAIPGACGLDTGRSCPADWPTMWSVRWFGRLYTAESFVPRDGGAVPALELLDQARGYNNPVIKFNVP